MPGERLSGLDASFLHLEDDAAHMHVGTVLLLAGGAPAYEDFLAHVERRLHLVPRYRRKLAFVPFGQGRPVWVDDPSFNLRYHVRHTALPEPRDEEQLRALAGRVFSQRLDRDKPLWELWLVDRVGEDRFAIITKTHHALVDGISGVDMLSVLFDTRPEPASPPPAEDRWLPRPLPSRTELLAEALVERATVPAEALRSLRALLRTPRRVAEGALERLAGVGALAWAGLNPAPPTPYNRRIGPHRRFAWVRASLGEAKQIKDVLGGTVNDVVLATVTGALRRHLRRRGVRTEGLELKAMVPVSVRSDLERGALGNRVTAFVVALPVWCEDPVERLRLLAEETRTLKEGGQAVGAEVLTRLAGFAPPTVLSQAARLVSRRRFFNLVVTNVPGPQFPLYLMGRELLEPFPMVPLARNLALGIAILSYHGRLDFGLVGDFDALADLDELAADVAEALEELRAAAEGVEVGTLSAR